MTVIGLEVPHVHVHLIPLHTMENARFVQKEKLSPEEFKSIAEAIKKALTELAGGSYDSPGTGGGGFKL